MIWAWKDRNPNKRASFYVPFAWLQEQWKEIHGAFHVNVKRIGGSARDAKRLSRYLVAQYCGNQSGLVRVSQSRTEFPISKMRSALLRTMRELPEQYEILGPTVKGLGYEEVGRISKEMFWRSFRSAWDELVQGRSCSVFGVQLAWWDGKLQRV